MMNDLTARVVELVGQGWVIQPNEAISMGVVTKVTLYKNEKYKTVFLQDRGNNVFHLRESTVDELEGTNWIQQGKVLIAYRSGINIDELTDNAHEIKKIYNEISMGRVTHRTIDDYIRMIDETIEMLEEIKDEQTH